MSERCPRCRGQLARGRDREVSCIPCGNIVEHGEPIGRLLVEDPPQLRDRARYPNAGLPWSEDDRAFVLGHRDDLSTADLAELVGRPPHAIDQLLSKAKAPKRRIRNLTKVAQPPAPPSGRWTDADVMEIEVGMVRGNLAAVAKRSGRSYWATAWRASREGMTHGEAEDKLTVLQVSQRFGCTRHRVMRLIDAGVLPATKAGGRYWRIATSDAMRCRRELKARSKFTPTRWRR